MLANVVESVETTASAILRKDKQSDNLYRVMLAQARAQDVLDLIESTFQEELPKQTTSKESKVNVCSFARSLLNIECTGEKIQHKL